MKVLDLYSGMGGWTQAFVDRGHEVIHVDMEERFSPDIQADVLKLTVDDLKGPWDVITASPPCVAFSLAGAGKGKVRWKKEAHAVFGPRVPIDDVSLLGCAMVIHTLGLVAGLGPRYWFLENPQGGLKTMGFMKALGEPVTITWCQYSETEGRKTMKPTNIWGKFPDTWTPRERCQNGDPCHEAAPRGARTGTQGLPNADLRAKIPYDLSLEVCIAVERAIS